MARNDVYLNINALSPADAVVTGQQDMTAATVPELVLGDTPTFNFYFTDNTNVWPSWAGNAAYTVTWALSDAVSGDFSPAATTGNATPITGGWSIVLPLNAYDLVGLLNTKRVSQPYPVTNLWQQIRVADPSGNEITRAMFWTPIRYRAISDTQNTESASPTGGREVTVDNVNVLTTPTAAQFYAANPVPTSALGSAANGELLIGNGTGFTKSTLTAGTGITITNGAGTVTIDASGAQEMLTATVVNAESVAITRGQVVYAYGATGNRMSVKLAYNTSDATSAKTIGVVSDASIAAGGTGLITCVGTQDKLQLGAYNEGDTLYLGATAGSVTATKPQAPNHLVYVGIVERANNGNGELYVKIQNGYELDEIHDVRITAPKQAGQTLIYDATNSLWKNARLTAGVGVAITNGDSSITISADGGVNYQGTWNASTNNPTLTSSVGTKGFYYVVSVAGSTNLNGVTDWKVGDWAIFNGTAWEKVDTTDQVSSVFGRTGAVVGVSTDYSSVGITNTAIGASNPSTGAFTTLSATGNLTISGTGTSSFAGPVTIVGTAAPWTGLNIYAYGSTPAATSKSLATFAVSNGDFGIGTAYYYNSNLWRAGSTTGAALRFRNDGSIDFVADTGLTANTDYTPNVRMSLSAAGNLTVTGTGTSSVAGRFGIGGASPVVGFASNEAAWIVGATAQDGAGIYPVTLSINDSRAYNSTGPQPGGGIGFTYKYNTAGNFAAGVSIQGFKENSTDGDYAGGLRFLVRANASSPVERMRLNSSGNLLLNSTGTDGGNGRLQLAEHTSYTGGIGVGTDLTVFRSSAKTLNIETSSHNTYVAFAPESSNWMQQNYATGFDSILRLTRATVADWDFVAGDSLIIKRNNTTALTLDSSQRCILAGALRLNNAYTAGAPTATGYVTLQDSAGNTYKVLVGT